VAIAAAVAGCGGGGGAGDDVGDDGGDDAPPVRCTYTELGGHDYSGPTCTCSDSPPAGDGDTAECPNGDHRICCEDGASCSCYFAEPWRCQVITAWPNCFCAFTGIAGAEYDTCDPYVEPGQPSGHCCLSTTSGYCECNRGGIFPEPGCQAGEIEVASCTDPVALGITPTRQDCPAGTDEVPVCVEPPPCESSDECPGECTVGEVSICCPTCFLDIGGCGIECTPL
jgi:hypothetical protein